MAFYYVKTS